MAALASGQPVGNSFGLRSRGPIDQEDSYKCKEGYEGHALVNNKLTPWNLNKKMGIRPIICINEDDIVDMQS